MYDSTPEIVYVQIFSPDSLYIFFSIAKRKT